MMDDASQITGNDNDNALGNELGNELPSPRPPLQFGLSTLLWLMVAVGVIFGTLRWMQVSTTTSLIVMALLAVSALAVVLLVVAISKIED
jgi:hypothetical protein